MHNERILDIGTGEGGRYIEGDNPSVIRIGLDIEGWRLHFLKKYWVQVLPVLASAQNIPFSENSMDMIEIVLPTGRLLVPGLQNHYPNHYPGVDKEFASPNDFSCPNGWYSEFARVLKPGGDLLIVGDPFIDLSSVINHSSNIFKTVSANNISIEELASYDTESTMNLLRKYMEEFDDVAREEFKKGLTQIRMKSKKLL